MPLFLLRWLLFWEDFVIVGREGLDKGNQDGVTHKLVDDLDSLVKFGRVGGLRATREAQQVVAYMGGKVNFTRTIGLDISLYKFLPQATDIIIVFLIVLPGLGICESVTIGFHGEL